MILPDGDPRIHSVAARHLRTCLRCREHLCRAEYCPSCAWALAGEAAIDEVAISHYLQRWAEFRAYEQKEAA